MIKVFNVVGARPQIIKASALSRAIKNRYKDQIKEVIVHTGQHYDRELSSVFFQELNIPEPDYNLGVGSGTHSQQTGRIMIGLEELLLKEKPDWVVVYGDTNSTLAAALAASKIQFPIVHIEAGLRSFDRSMPEEVNRIVTDHLSTLLFSPTNAGFKNLMQEGFKPDQSPPYSPDHPKIYHSGDIMYDNALYFGALSDQKMDFLSKQGIEPGKYLLVTIHRENNTDNVNRLENILKALLMLTDDMNKEVVLPLHPRTAKVIEDGISPALREKVKATRKLRIMPPVSFLEVMLLERHAEIIMTDSGGVQKESHFFRKPCIIFRKETEWVELVTNGTCHLADADKGKILKGYNMFTSGKEYAYPEFYGDGKTAEFICREMIDNK
jgi:UDP-GlcNAc3NAcA epimerase